MIPSGKLSGRIVWFLLIPVTPVGAWGQSGHDKTDLPQAARTLYDSAMNQYNSQHWEQAQTLLGEFTRQYSSNEEAPRVLMHTAYCALHRKDDKAFTAAMDACIRNYYGSPTWFYANGTLLNWYREKGDRDNYIKAFEQMLRKSKIVPDDLPFFTKQTWRGLKLEYTRMLESRQWDDSFSAAPGAVSWHANLVWAGDTPDRAKRVLRMLTSSLKYYDKEVPHGLQYAHVRLLYNAGDKKKAEETLDEYLDEWGEDVYGVQLRMRILWDAKVNGVEISQTDAFWKALLTRYIHYGSMEGWSGDLLRSLQEADEFESYCELLPAYCAIPRSTQTASSSRARSLTHLVALATKKPKKTAPPRLDKALALLREIPAYSVAEKQAKLRHQITLLLALRKPSEAAALTEDLLRQYWSEYNYRWVGRNAKDCPAVEAALKQACAKWKAPELDPQSEAAGQLEDVKRKIKEDRVQIADELATAMLTKYPNAAATIEAAHLLMEHYYTKLLPEPRNRWAQRMAESFPHHPLTEQAIRRQITACKAARDPRQAIPWLKRLPLQFPGTKEYGWYDTMLWRYESLKDPAGRYQFQKEYFKDAVAANSLDEKKRLLEGEYSSGKFDTAAARGQFWLQRAPPLKGTKLEPWVYFRAWQGAFDHWGKKNTDYDLARQAVEGMRNQKADPELAWKVAFEKVNLFSHKGDTVQAKAELDAVLSGRQTSRDVAMRLNFPRLGEALGDPQSAPQAKNIASSLAKIIYTRRDKMALSLMLGNIYAGVKDRKNATRNYMAVIEESPFPAQMHEVFLLAFGQMSQNDSGINWETEARNYIATIPTAQKYAIEALYLIGRRYVTNKDQKNYMRIHKELAAKYPASFAREELEQAIKERIQREEEKKNKKKDPKKK
jgi:hypothetical protein